MVSKSVYTNSARSNIIRNRGLDSGQIACWLPDSRIDGFADSSGKISKRTSNNFKDGLFFSPY